MCCPWLIIKSSNQLACHVLVQSHALIGNTAIMLDCNYGFHSNCTKKGVFGRVMVDLMNKIQRESMVFVWFLYSCINSLMPSGLGAWQRMTDRHKLGSLSVYFKSHAAKLLLDLFYPGWEHRSVKLLKFRVVGSVILWLLSRAASSAYLPFFTLKITPCTKTFLDMHRHVHLT